MNPLAFLDQATPPPRLVLNPHYLAESRLLRRSEFYSRQQLDDLKLDRLKAICLYAYDNCPYYTRLFDESGFDPQRMSSPEDLRVDAPARLPRWTSRHTYTT